MKEYRTKQINVILTLWIWNLKSQRISMRLTPEEIQKKRM